MRDELETEGEYFHGLDGAGRREYLKTCDIRAEKVKRAPLPNDPLDPDHPGVQAARVLIDGDECGEWPYPASPHETWHGEEGTAD